MHIQNSLVFVFLFFLLTHLHAQIEVDVFQEQLKETIKKHGVKSQTTWNHAFSGDSPVVEGYRNALLSFDRNGNLVEEIKYNSGGNVFMMETFQFNDLDLNTGYVRFDGNENKITVKRMFRYDHDGNRLVEVGFDGMSNYRNQFSYDAQGRLASIFYFTGTSTDQAPNQKRIFEYKSNQHRLIRVYDREDNYLFKLEQRFDNRGNLIEDSEFDPDNDNAVARQFKYTYNANNQVLTEERYESGQLRYRRDFRYSSGQLQRIMHQQGTAAPFDLRTYEYDNSGRLVREQYRRRGNQEFSSKEFKYDSRGLCVEEISYYASYKYRVLFKYEYEFH